MVEKSQNLDKDIPDILKSYYKAKDDGTLVQYYLDKFRNKRDNYLDDLPSFDVRTLGLDEKGNFISSKYKCGGNYIVGLALTLESAIEDNIITNSELIETIQKFRHHNFNYYTGKFTSKQEIDMINNVLKNSIQNLETR